MADRSKDLLEKIQAQEKLPFGFMEPLENFFDGMGMMRGQLAPFKRAAVGFAVGALIMSALRPEWAYDPDTGRALTRKETTVTWWMPPLALAAFTGTCI